MLERKGAICTMGEVVHCGYAGEEDQYRNGRKQGIDVDDAQSEPQRVVAMMRTWANPGGGRSCGRCSIRRSCLPWRTAAVERGMAAGMAVVGNRWR